METVFRDRVAWVTGASSGIGEALAERLAASGARLVLSCNDEANMQRVASRLCAADRIALLPLDLAKPETLTTAPEKALACFGQIDYLFNNAGVSQRELAENTKIEIDRLLMEINYFGPLALTKGILPHFLARRSGHFVVVSSMAGKIGSPLRSAYAAAKHALYGFFESLRAEVASRGVHVTMVCPGFVHTNISLHALRGDGQLYGIMDPRAAHGVDAMKCADRILHAVARNKNEVYVGGTELAMIYLYRLLPDLFARVLPRVAVT